jgi:hypothetical protein
VKEAFLSGFYGAAHLFVDLVRARFLVMRNFIVHPDAPFHGCHVEYHRGREA